MIYALLSRRKVLTSDAVAYGYELLIFTLPIENLVTIFAIINRGNIGYQVSKTVHLLGWGSAPSSPFSGGLALLTLSGDPPLEPAVGFYITLHYIRNYLKWPKKKKLQGPLKRSS